MSDKQWQDLMDDWQACDVAKSTSSEELADLKALEDKTRKKARTMSYFMWADVISVIIFVAFFGYLFFTDITLYQKIIFAGVVFIILPMGIYSVLVRKGLWEVKGTDTKAYLELAKGRALAGVKLAKANAYAALIAFPFIIIVMMWHASNMADTVSWPFNRFVFGTLFQLLIFALMYYGAKRYQRKKQAEYEQLSQTLDEWAE